MKIFSASLATETNTFAPLPTGIADFKRCGYFPAGTHPDQMQRFAGPLWAARQRAREHRWQLVEGMVAYATPGGLTTRSAYEALRDELLADLKAALPVEMVVLGLHGAMVADGYDDCEGDLLARVRQIGGSDVVIGAEIDPHANLSERMVKSTDLIIAFKEYPHTDILERAYDLVDLCVCAAQGSVRLVPALFDCQMIRILHTSREPMRSFVDRIKSIEGRNGVLSISPVHGFPWGDVADLGTRMLVYTNGDANQARRLAHTLGEELMAMGDRMRADYLSIDAALDQALAVPKGRVVVLADSADNAGGGAPSDATFILRRLIDRKIRHAVLGPLWDPIAVSIAFNAGEGALIPLRIGGKIGVVSGDPVDAMVCVRTLRRNFKMTGLANTQVDLGDSALIDIDGIGVVLTSVRTQGFNTDLFTQFGCDLFAQRIIVVKSSQHFYASFSKVASKVIYVDAPGAVTNDLKGLPYRKARRELIESFR